MSVWLGLIPLLLDSTGKVVQWILGAISSRWEGLITQYSLQQLWFCLLSGKNSVFCFTNNGLILSKGKKAKTPLKADFFSIRLFEKGKKKSGKAFLASNWKKRKSSIALLGTVKLGNISPCSQASTPWIAVQGTSQKRSCYLKAIKASSFPLEGRWGADSTAPGRLWALLHHWKGDFPADGPGPHLWTLEQRVPTNWEQHEDKQSQIVSPSGTGRDAEREKSVVLVCITHSNLPCILACNPIFPVLISCTMWVLYC